MRFFSKDEQLGLVEAQDQNKKDWSDQPKDWLEGLRNKFDWRSDRKIGADELNHAWHKMIDFEQITIKDAMQLGASLGILGNNDCALFARTLHELIQEEKEQEKRTMGTSGQVAEREDNEPVVGTFMQHKFPQKTNDCTYHGVTVVAKDGATLVTLEAHAGKKSLKKPEFHMRNGVRGFIADNTPPGLSQEEQEKWANSTVEVKHPDKQSDVRLGGSLQEDMATYTELHGKKPITTTDLGLRMSKMGVTKK